MLDFEGVGEIVVLLLLLGVVGGSASPKILLATRGMAPFRAKLPGLFRLMLISSFVIGGDSATTTSIAGADDSECPLSFLFVT